MNQQAKVWEQLNQNWSKWDYKKDCYPKRKIRMFTTKNLSVVLNIISEHADEKKLQFGENHNEYLAWKPIIKYVEKLIKKRSKSFEICAADAEYYFGGK